jgi:hypothetical protein
MVPTMRTVLFVLALIGGFGVTGEARGGSHCAGHSVAIGHRDHPAAGHQHSAVSASWDRPTHSDCSHCPPAQCARTFPCAASLVCALVPSRTGFATPIPHLIVAAPISAYIGSANPAPPTPPPQAAA